MSTLTDTVARALRMDAMRDHHDMWDTLTEISRDVWRRAASAALTATADHLDAMGTDTDEDSAAVEWITGLLREGATP